MLTAIVVVLVLQKTLVTMLLLMLTNISVATCSACSMHVHVGQFSCCMFLDIRPPVLHSFRTCTTLHNFNLYTSVHSFFPVKCVGVLCVQSGRTGH